MEAIEVENLTKQFGSSRVLESLSFGVGEGKLVLLFGPNGSGKTTLLRCLMGLIRFGGEVRIFGFDVLKLGKEARRLVSYMPQDSGFYGDMTCSQVLDFFSDLRGVDVDLEEILGPINLMDKADAKIRELSGGMRRKLGIAVTLLGDPPVVLMDEPFGDIDTRGRVELLKTIQVLKERGRTVLISTHTLSGVLTMADSAILLERGKPVRTVRSKHFASYFKPSYRLHFRSDSDVALYEEVDVSATGWATLTSADLYSTLGQLAACGVDLSRVIVEEPSLDDLFVRSSNNDI